MRALDLPAFLLLIYRTIPLQGATQKYINYAYSKRIRRVKSPYVEPPCRRRVSTRSWRPTARLKSPPARKFSVMRLLITNEKYATRR